MSILQEHWQIVLLFFGVALLYSSVGFGGGSSYLAVLALFGLEFKFLRAISLLCNITVVSNGSLQYFKKGFLDFKKVLPLVLMSIPMAFLGGKLPLTEKTFFILLAFTLFVAAILVWFQPWLIKQSMSWKLSSENVLINLIIGGIIGFISGMVGIGGGIFLSPVLFILDWDEPKKIAATASFFILVNSIAGLAGQFQNSELAMDWTFALVLMASVALGGFIGTYLGTSQLRQDTVRKGTALLIAYVAYNLMMRYV